MVIQNGLRWGDKPKDQGPHKAIYNRFIRSSRLGIFSRIFAALAAKRGRPDQLMIGATHRKAHRMAASLLKEGCSPTYRRHQRRPELKARCGLRRSGPSVCDGQGRPLVMLLREGQMSDDKGAVVMLDVLPPAP